MLAEHIRPDHEDRAGDHLHGAEQFLAGALDYVGPGKLRTDATRDPIFGSVQDVPLVTLHDGQPVVHQLGVLIFAVVPVTVTVTVAVYPEKVGQELLEYVGRWNEIRVEDHDKLRTRIGNFQRLL